jgi:hypothetical protein
METYVLATSYNESVDSNKQPRRELRIQNLQCLEREVKTRFVLIRTRQLNKPTLTLQTDQIRE